MDEHSKQLRSLELEAYAAVVTALRAQGELTKEKRKLLLDLQKSLNISFERHRAEVRRAINDEGLKLIASECSGSKSDDDWIMDGRRVIPALPRAIPKTAYNRSKTLLDVIWKERKSSNKKSLQDMVTPMNIMVSAVAEDKCLNSASKTVISSGQAYKSGATEIKTLYGRKRSNSNETLPIDFNQKSSNVMSDKNVPSKFMPTKTGTINLNKAHSDLGIPPAKILVNSVNCQETSRVFPGKPTVRSISVSSSSHNLPDSTPILDNNYSGSGVVSSASKVSSSPYLAKGTIMKVPSVNSPVTSSTQFAAPNILVRSNSSTTVVRPPVIIKGEVLPVSNNVEAAINRPRPAVTNPQRLITPLKLETSASLPNSTVSSSSQKNNPYFSTGMRMPVKKVISPMTTSGAIPHSRNSYENELMTFLIRQDMQMHRSSSVQAKLPVEIKGSALKNTQNMAHVDEENHFVEEGYNAKWKQSTNKPNLVAELTNDAYSDGSSLVAEEVIISGSSPEVTKSHPGIQYIHYSHVESDSNSSSLQLTNPRTIRPTSLNISTSHALPAMVELVNQSSLVQADASYMLNMDDSHDYCHENGSPVVNYEHQYDSMALIVPETVQEINKSASFCEYREYVQTSECVESEKQFLAKNSVPVDNIYVNEHKLDNRFDGR